MANTGKQVLSVKFSGMEENNEKKSKVIVEVIEFGPLKITGNFVIKDLQRNTESAPGEIRLCRCGKSANKPYCDDSCKK
jgi:CDGSH iron-sulfur domain-containing protein 3